ncbi:hypothetical protein [Microbacterium oxydans]|uniref:hypothetical protein n=1 Tax=Microbacterium oxydans TaxID=82380 RepID=UPI00226B4149|nr:hypothetical protein [Microbacterium oxydans]WAA67789.1 hypothetical protein MME74_08545 [Microbacterium oxydans]
MTTHTDELERTLASDPVLSDEQHAAEVYLARTLAAELDAQATRGELQTRTVASYAGVLGALRRVVRDERERRRRATAKPEGAASRLALMRREASRITALKEDADD